MKSIRKIIHVNESAFRRANVRTQNLINTLAVLTPISALVNAAMAYISFNYFFEYWSVSLAFSLLIFMLFFNHDSTLLEELNIKNLYIRSIFSVVLVTIVMIPFKVEFIGHENVVQQIKEAAAEINNEVHAEFLSEKAKIDNREDSLFTQVTKAAQSYDQGNKQYLADARRELKAFQKKKPGLISDLELYYKNKKQVAKTSKLDIASYYFHNSFNLNDPSQTFINLFLLVFVLLFETSPVLLRMLLNQSEYIAYTTDVADFSEKIRIEKSKSDDDEDDEKKIIELIEKAEKRRLWNAFETEARSDFSNPQRLHEIAKKANQLREKKKKEPPLEPKPKEQNVKSDNIAAFAEFSYNNQKG